MGLNETLAKMRGLDADEKTLLIATLPLRGGYSGATGSEGIDLTTTDYTPSLAGASDGYVRKVYCAGNAGNVKFDMADGSVHILPIAANDWLFPVAGFITKIYKTGTTATVLHVFW